MLKLIVCLTCTLQWLPRSNTLHLSGNNSVKPFTGDAGLKVPAEHFNIMHRRLNSSRRSFDKNEKGREIIEITSADPTTESTLIVPNYPIDCVNERECELVASISSGVETTPMPTFKPYSQEELNSYLENFVNKNGKLPDDAVIKNDQPTNKLANLYMNEPVNILEGTLLKDEGKSHSTKSWQLLQAQKHKNPYDDRTGWVSLEPVPWSASQVQKWEPNNKPQHPHWSESGNTGGSSDQEYQSSWNKPSTWQDRPWNKKPTYEYKPSSKPPWNEYTTGNHWNNGNGGGNSEIITDSGPSHFPHFEPTKKPDWHDRPQSGYNNENTGYQNHHHPSNHPSEGDGHWVLLSSTKGYSVPHRSRSYQRSLLINSKVPPLPQQEGIPSMKSHRSVRLTVLPALNGTTNTTTSHGGLLEVEQTFQTVDEAQREHAAKMLRLGEAPEQGKMYQQQQPIPIKRSGTTVKIYPIKPSVLHAKSKAMLAAVGAGMIPATMAMLVPMVLGRKRRSLSTKYLQHKYYINPHYNLIQ